MYLRMTPLTLWGLALTLALPSTAAAWHKEGHMAIARIAWKQLGDKEQVQIAKILKSHPHYGSYLLVNKPNDLEDFEWAFVRAATWPDWVRDPFGPGLSKEDRIAIVKRSTSLTGTS
jgi:S1/P1 Nuclease